MSIASLAGEPSRTPLLRRAAGIFLLILLYLLAAGASFDGFYSRWGLSEARPFVSAAAMLDGTADRPFVYRQLLPEIARAVSAALPESIRDGFAAFGVQPSDRLPGKTKLGLWPGVADQPAYVLPYYVLYLSSFSLYFLALFLMRHVCLANGMGPVSATMAPAIFALGLPLVVSYFYDFSEIFFLFLALCCARPGRRWLLVPIAAFAAWNKEAYLFFVLALSTLYIRSRRDVAGLAVIGVSALISGAVYLYEKGLYRQNGGGNVQFHLWDNIAFYANPLNLVRRDIIYGIPLLANYSLLTVAALVAVVALGWRRLPPRMKLFTVACLAISAPLFALFTAPGSLRNLSFLYPSVVVLIAATLDGLRERADDPA